MPHSQIANQFEDDLQYLAWRIETHRFSSEEIQCSFIHLINSYSGIASEGDRNEIVEVTRHWSAVMEKAAYRHRLYPSSGVTPIHRWPH